MAEYRVICIVRGSNGEAEAVGYSKSGNGVMYDDRWTLEQARSAIEEGHRLYTVNPSTGEEVDLDVSDGTLQPGLGRGLDVDLRDLPDCR